MSIRTLRVLTLCCLVSLDLVAQNSDVTRASLSPYSFTYLPSAVFPSYGIPVSNFNPISSRPFAHSSRPLRHASSSDIAFFPSGRLGYDLSHSLQSQESSPELKSPLTAAMLSAAVPGVGQAYGDDWSVSWRSLAFLGAEVLLWTGYAVNDAKADEQTEIFKRYADQHWDVVRYLDWTTANMGVDCSAAITSSDPNLPPWERVDWDEMNRCEEQVGATTGSGYTHRLPRRPEQQYYELIGKYPQFGGGWDDAAGFLPGDILTDNVSPRFLEYRTMRGRANDLYNMASTYSYVIVANHVLSALEAAWSTSKENRRLRAEVLMRRSEVGVRTVYWAELGVKVRIGEK